MSAVLSAGRAEGARPGGAAPARAVLFDMDGVLVDSEAVIAEAAVAMFARDHGLAVRAADFLPFVGTGEARYLGGVAGRYGLVLDLEEAKRSVYVIYFELIRGRLAEIPGARAYLRACRDRGLKVAIATSADRAKMAANLLELGLVEADFDAIVTGLDVVRKKPFPDIYLEASRRVGVPPAECLVVEDAVEGVRAAKAAGCACLGLSTTFPSAELLAAGADAVASDLRGLEPGVA